MWRIRSSRSGCSIGSPPLNATTEVPSSASLSMRRHHVGRDRRRHLVVLVAVAAVDVAAADRDDLDEQRVRRVRQPAREFARRDRALCGWRGRRQCACRHEVYQTAQAFGSPHWTQSRRCGRPHGLCRPAATCRRSLRPESRRAAGAAPTAARPADAMQPQLRQSGVPPNWHGVIWSSRSAEMRRRRPREHALVGRRGRVRVHLDHAFGISSFGIARAAAPCRSATTRSRSAGRSRLGRQLADLRRVEADPDLARLVAGRPEAAGTPRGSRAVDLLRVTVQCTVIWWPTMCFRMRS